jgi:putative ATP-dependent endonuclease of the OLD family
MHISHFRVKGFRSLQDVEATLSKYTTLIGKNDSGKSSFLKAIQLLFDTSLNLPM